MTLLLLSLVLSAPPANGPNPFLAQARELYANLDFERCVQRLQQAPQWRSTPAELRDVELLAGLCHFSLGHKAEAAERFKLALRIDEGADLPPYSSPKAVELFLRVKKRLQRPAPPMPLSDLGDDDLVSELDAPVKPTGEASGRFDVKKYPVPIAMAVISLAGLGTGIGMGVSAKSTESQARLAVFEDDYLRLRHSAQTSAVGANIAYATAAAALIIAVVIFVVTE